MEKTKIKIRAIQMKKTVFFDMDGTITGLYEVPSWLEDIKKSSCYPFIIADSIPEEESFVAFCKSLKKKGYQVGVISWTPKNATKKYCKAVKRIKIEWLKRYGDIFDVIHIIPYGSDKNKFCKTMYDILYDDEENNRLSWAGIARDEKQLKRGIQLCIKKY